MQTLTPAAFNAAQRFFNVNPKQTVCFVTDDGYAYNKRMQRYATLRAKKENVGLLKVNRDDVLNNASTEKEASKKTGDKKPPTIKN